MSETTRKRILYVALVLAIIYGANHFLGERRSVQVEPPATIKPIAADTLDRTAQDSLDVTALAAAKWGRDPFQSPRRAPGPRVTWEVRGIVYSPTEPMAYVNGERVGIDDRVDGARVVRIERKKVTVEIDGRQFDLYVAEG